MSDIQNRSSASRGRVSARGGRGGFSSRGGRGGNRSANDNSDVSSFEEGEIGQMKKKYSDTLPTLKEMFPDWKDEDLVFALEDSNGELLEAIERISEGNVSQWGEVKKKTADRTRPKPKETPSASTETTTPSTRGTRGRGGIEGRGRVRADRGRGGRGGRAGAATNGTRASTAVETSAPTAIPATTSEWATPKAEETVGDSTAEGEWESTEPKSSVIPEGTKKGWASLFAKPPAPPVQKKPQAAPPVPVAEKPAEPVAEPSPPAPAPAPAPEPVTAPATSQKTPVAKPTHPVIPAIPTTTVNPPKGDLTETNLEQVPDASAPAPTATAASTIGSGVDPAAVAAATATPSRFPSSAYPSSATKQGRTPGLQRRVMEQQQAVVMPGNHAVDRAAVQFGSMGLNGDAIDIDENREEAETRAQPPQHSPVAPRASLPPATQAPHSMESGAAGRPAPGLPPVPQGASADSFTDFARYSEPQQKPFDPFTQPVSQPQPQIPEPFANQAPAQPTATTGSEYSPFYAAEQQRFPYYASYGSYGQSQDAPTGPRAGAGFGVSGAEVQAQIPSTQPPNRYVPVDATNSGHNTPNPTIPGVTQQTPAAQHMPGQSAQQHAYGYQYPNYYTNPHYASYMNQMGQQQQQQQYGGGNRPRYDDARRYEDHYMQQQQQHNQQYGYGSQYGPYAGKGGMYGQPHGAFSYDQQSSSPANTGSFSQAMPSRDSVYGRTGSAQQSDNQSATGANAFGTGMSDVFSRSQGSFGQNPPIAGQPPVTTDETKGFEAPKAGGPSPSLAQNRPGSATNSVPGQPQAQTGLPPLQGQQGQQTFGSYPQLNPQYGGLGGLGHQGAATQASGYGNNYGGGFGNYYGNSGRGGWGGNYGH
ncbi:Ubiquitin system component Cue [Penicillium mononematosum]|uniref:Ubiquitin system component Cue n=1 Tax=Penicillium mononematosum TaxID=268346 RepID=UPI002548566D|nr:Ubiquitin system component Cue [Penicillium mononematosum]KAJ6187687.1 Ubiquitin system component Cue [Penicillium mononematosum]